MVVYSITWRYRIGDAMRVLELFAGTGSVGRVARNFGHEVVSLDRAMDADIRCDVMLWDYKTFERGHFDVIWASPPCTEYSSAKTVGVRRLAEANDVVMRTLDIIDHLHPKYWILENPQTGLLKRQFFMTSLPYDDVDYCRYGTGYRKRTRLWHNTPWKPRPLCKGDCGSVVDGRHREVAQRGPGRGANGARERGQRHTQRELYRVPEALLEEIWGALE